MLDHVEAFKVALTVVGLDGHFVDVPDGSARPYVLLWTGSGRAPTEDAVAPGTDFEDTLGVTAVADTPEGALVVQRRARAAFSPFAGGSDAVFGRRVWLDLYDSRAVQVDRDVTDTLTGRHPAFGVDLYHLVSVPT